MPWWLWFLIGFGALIVIGQMVEAGKKAEQKKKFEEARIVNWPNIHGTRKIATENELKKRGLI
jgi:hypothetical protein